MYDQDDYPSLFLSATTPTDYLLLDDDDDPYLPKPAGGAATSLFDGLLFPFDHHPSPLPPLAAGSPSALSTSSSSEGSSFTGGPSDDSRGAPSPGSSSGGGGSTLFPPPGTTADPVDGLLFGAVGDAAGWAGIGSGTDDDDDGLGRGFGAWADQPLSQQVDANLSYTSSSTHPDASAGAPSTSSTGGGQLASGSTTTAVDVPTLFDPLALDLDAFTLPAFPAELAQALAGHSHPQPPSTLAHPHAPLPSPPPMTTTPHDQHPSSSSAIPPFVLAHIENNPAFPASSPAAGAAIQPSGPPSLKRKASPSAVSASPSPPAAGQPQPPTTTTKPVSDHNAIERKYRDNIHDAHVKLRDAVPVLRVLFNTTTALTLALDTPSPSTGLIDGQPPETKQGKATVLTAAREYIFQLQLSRAAERRYAAWLEERIGESRGLRGEWEAEDELEVLEDPYLRALKEGTLWRSFPQYAEREAEEAAAAGGPKRKRAKQAPKATTATAAKGLLAVGLGFGIGWPAAASSSARSAAASIVPDSSTRTETSASSRGGRLIGRTAKVLFGRPPPADDVEGRVASSGSRSNLVGPVLLGLVVALLVVSLLRWVARGVSRARAARRSDDIAVALARSTGSAPDAAAAADDDDDDDSDAGEAEDGASLSRPAPRTLRHALGVDGTVSVVWQLATARFGWLGGGGEVMHVEREAWVRLAEETLAVPTDLASYLLLALVGRKLAIHLPTTPPTARADQLVLLALTTHALAGAPPHPPAQALAHWTAAREAAAATVAAVAAAEGRQADEVLALSLADACAVCPDVLAPRPTGSAGGPGATARIGDALALRDLRALWVDVQAALAPRSSRLLIDRHATPSPTSSSPTSPTSISSSTTATTAAPLPVHPFGHLLTHRLAPAHRRAVSLELAAIERSTSAGGGPARELALVSSAVWALIERDAPGVQRAVGKLLVGGGGGGGRRRSARGLGQAARALIDYAGIRPRSSADDDEAKATQPATAAAAAAVRELNLTLAFLLAYLGSLARLGGASASSSSSSSSSTPSRASGLNADLLHATLRARALLHELDALAPATVEAEEDDDGGEGVEAVRERFGAALFGVGRWAAGWKDERAEEDDDSGFEDGW